MAKKVSEGEGEITPIPKVDKDWVKEVTLTQIVDGKAYTRLLYDEKKHEYLYEIIEPPLTAQDIKTLAKVKQKFIENVDEGVEELSVWERNKYLRTRVEQIIAKEKIKLDKVAKERLFYYIQRDLLGYGKIDVLMIDHAIEDISCDGPNIPIYIYHRKYEGMRTNLIFRTPEELDRFVITLAQKCSKDISIASPLLDATIPDGSRLQATLAKEVTTRGSSFTVRRFKANPLTPSDLVGYHTFSPEMMAYCWLAVENGESMLISGGTASGKTTTLNAISLFIPPQMKIVSIEDTREINIPHENWVAGLTRGGFGGRVEGEVDMFQLMKAALRQRPQYIIVGEVRGKEAYIVFQAMATGKATYSTVHADSIGAILHRLENPPISLPRVLISALNIVLLQAQVKVGDKMVRRIKRVVEIVGLDPDTQELTINTVFEWNPAEDKFSFLGHSELFERIMKHRSLSRKKMQQEFASRAKLVKWMQEKGINDYKKVGEIVSAYYKDPKSVLKRVETESN